MKKPKIGIIYEDSDVLVLDKPSGISVHGDGRTKEYTVADWILENFPKLKNVGEPITLTNGDKILRPGIVHRLDKDTSGVLVVAKTKKSYEFLKAEFKWRQTEKVYVALVHGKFKEDTGLIDKPIGRSGNDFRAKATGHAARGEMRQAITYYKVIGKLGDYSLLEVRPKTGRTHQIRVHLSSIGRPVLCDEIYAKSKVCPEWMGRLALHALSLGISTPNGGKMTFESPIPKDIASAIAKLKSL